MADDLYFIPIIARALEAPDPKTAVIEAFDRIHAMGQQPQYSHGYQQFAMFLDAVAGARWKDAPERTGRLILEEVERQQSVEIIVERDGDVVATCRFEHGIGTAIAQNLVAGEYVLRFDTGRILWNGRLAEEDLIWKKAYPRRNLPVAADSGRPTQVPTERF